MHQQHPTTQADGEGPESAEEMTQTKEAPSPLDAKVMTVRTCWDCGSEFTPTFARQWECTRCYVAGKL